MHNVLNMKEWQLSDINVIKDLKINNGIIDEKYIFYKLKTNNWIVQMMLVKNAVKPYIKIIDSNNPNLAADGLNTNIIGKSKVLYTNYNSSFHVTSVGPNGTGD